MLLTLFAACSEPKTPPDLPLGLDRTDSIEIVRDSPAAGALLRCVVRPDPLGDPGRPGAVGWSVDGEPYVGIDGVVAGDTVPAGVTRDGETWQCALTDGGAVVATDAVTIDASLANVLVVLIDDVGTVSVGEGHRTPTLDGLAAQGVSFDAAYANPLCSASRASLQTGRYGRRFGVGNALRFHDDTVGMPASETTVAEVVRDAGYATAMIGKWHLAVASDDDPPADPLDQGYDWFDGVVANLALHLVPDHLPRSYFHWDHSVQGVLSTDDRYVVTAQTDAALAFIDRTPGPWLTVLAFTGAHSPFHVPPPELAHPPEGDDVAALDAAMVEAVDTELGRLLASIDPEVLAHTYVIVTSDNGTPSGATDADGEGKGTLAEGGVHVPFVVTGPGVAEPGSTSPALVHLVDILPTAAAIAGVAPDPGVALDGHSLWRFLEHPDAEPVRDVVYDEMFSPSGAGPYDKDGRSVRDADYRLIRDLNGESLYRIAPGGVDGPGLLAGEGELTDRALEAYARLWLDGPPRRRALTAVTAW